MELFAKMDVKAIQNGLIEKVGGVKHFTVLAVIAAYANSKGEAYPSQDTIASLVGYSRKTINATISDLRNITIDGEPILKVVQEKSSTGRRNKYVISPKSGFWFGSNIVTKSNDNVTLDGRDNVTQGLQEGITISNNNQKNYNQEQDIIFENSKEVLQYFRKKYFDKYKVAYQPNWGRDQSMIKTKLLSTFTDSQIKSIIDIVFEEYDKRWAKPNFPRPSIGQLCSWLPNEALAIVAKKQQEAERIEVDSKKYEMNDDYFNKLLDEI